MSFPKTLSAMQEQEDRSWSIADALVDEITPGKHGEYERCARWLAEQGYEVTPRYLSDMRLTGSKFPAQSRTFRVPFRLYMQAATNFSRWTPALMAKAEREKWTLRQFSEQLTGRRWADDDIEAARRAIADPRKRETVFSDPQTARHAANDTHVINRVGAEPIISARDHIDSLPRQTSSSPSHIRHEPGLAKLYNGLELIRQGGQELRGAHISEATKEELHELAEKVESAGIWIRTIADGETMDEALERMLNG